MKKLHYAIQQYQKIKLLLVNSQKFTKINRTVKEKNKDQQNHNVIRGDINTTKSKLQRENTYQQTYTDRHTSSDWTHLGRRRRRVMGLGL